MAKDTTPSWMLPMSFKKAGVVYTKGDHVMIQEGDQTFEGIIKCVLSTQLVLELKDSDKQRFFFQTGLRITKVGTPPKKTRKKKV